MRTRQGLLDLFSTFLQFDADTFSRWVSDPRLRRSMEACLHQSSEEQSERFWALYWHRVWQAGSNPLAASHLTAYLQEVCYWTARKLSIKLSGNASIADLFQTAIARIDKVFKNFNPQFSSNLKSYAELVLGGVIKDQVQKQQETGVCTDWALLHRTSQKRLVEALQFAGENQEAIKRYVLAWTCFQEMYAPDTAQTARRLDRPDAQSWQAITQIYRAEQLAQLGSSQPCSPEGLEKWLLASAKAVRAFLYPTKISIYTPIPGQETGELLDQLPGSQDSLLTEAIAQEAAEIREEQNAQINQVLIEALKHLGADAQMLLQLYYQQKLTQQQIAKQLGIKQYSISRQLARLRQSLLLTLAQWSQQNLHIALTSQVLDSMSTALEEWLNAHYCPPDLPM